MIHSHVCGSRSHNSLHHLRLIELLFTKKTSITIAVPSILQALARRPGMAFVALHPCVPNVCVAALRPPKDPSTGLLASLVLLLGLLLFGASATRAAIAAEVLLDLLAGFGKGRPCPDDVAVHAIEAFATFSAIRWSLLVLKVLVIDTFMVIPSVCFFSTWLQIHHFTFSSLVLLFLHFLDHLALPILAAPKATLQ